MLVELGIEVGNVVTRAQVIRMIEVQILFKRGLAVGVGVGDILAHEFGGDARGAGVDVLGPGRPRARGKKLVDVDRLALGAALDDAVALVSRYGLLPSGGITPSLEGIVFVGLLVAVVEEAMNAVLLIPDNGAE